MNDARSWTDPVLNTFMLSGFDPIAYAKWLGHRRLEFESVIGDFLHEITHHRCFNSLIGGVIALLQLRAGQSAFIAQEFLPLSEPERVDLRRRAVEDLHWVHTTTQLLLPLAEGFAQFAEFDIRESHQKFISTPLKALLAC